MIVRLGSIRKQALHAWIGSDLDEPLGATIATVPTLTFKSSKSGSSLLALKKVAFTWYLIGVSIPTFTTPRNDTLSEGVNVK